MQTEKIQYDSCNASAGSGMFKYSGFCPAPGSDIRLTLTENSQDLTNTVNFINNSIYYFTSRSLNWICLAYYSECYSVNVMVSHTRLLQWCTW